MSATTPFSFPVRVHYDDTDSQGRVFYASYFPLIDQARCAFWEDIGLTEDDTRRIEHETVIVHVEADYLGPAEFYDLLRVYVAVEKLGRSSLHLRYQVVQTRTDQEIFTARMVMVQADLVAERSVPWDATFRAAVIRHQGSQVVS